MKPVVLALLLTSALAVCLATTVIPMSVEELAEVSSAVVEARALES